MAKVYKGTDVILEYTWVEKGSSYLPSELQAAYLLAQLEASRVINGKRMKIWKAYEKALLKISDGNGFRVLKKPAQREHNAHLFWLLFENNFWSFTFCRS